MLRLLQAIAGIAMLALAGCNSAGGITPQEDIPNVPASAQAQTQPQEAEQQQAMQQQQPRANASLYQQPASSMPPIDSDPSPGAPPQNTLNGQADAMARGEDNPSMTKPQSGSLGANLYRTDAAAKETASIYSPHSVKGTIRFLPIIGAPLQAVTPLSKELGEAARGNGLTIKPSGDMTAQHVLKGYLSAFSDGKKVTIVYVWDVLDNSGARLHRIQGQEVVPGAGGDPWASTPPEVMQEIGSNTIAEYMKWRDSTP